MCIVVNRSACARLVHTEREGWGREGGEGGERSLGHYLLPAEESFSAFYGIQTHITRMCECTGAHTHSERHWLLGRSHTRAQAGAGPVHAKDAPPLCQMTKHTLKKKVVSAM